jgi:hypothetical protein
MKKNGGKRKHIGRCWSVGRFSVHLRIHPARAFLSQRRVRDLLFLSFVSLYLVRSGLDKLV